MIIKYLVRLCAPLFALLVAGLLAEGYLRIYMPQSHDRYTRFETINNFKHFTHDPNTGWRGRPNYDGTVSREDFLVRFHQNSYGFRGENFQGKQSGKKRILALGDSFVWGWGVDNTDTFVDHVTNENSGIEMLNLGISGYSTDQEFLLAKDMSDKLQPDAIFLFYYINDTLDNMSKVYEDGKWPKPFFSYQADGSLAPENLPIENIEERLMYFDNGIHEVKTLSPKNITQRVLNASYLASFLADKSSDFAFVRHWLESRGVLAAFATRDIGNLLGKIGDNEPEYWKKTADLMSLLQQYAQSKHIPLVVFYLPFKQQIYPETIKESQRTQYDLDRPQTELSRLLGERGISFIDLTGAFKEDRKKNSKDLFFRTDEHFTPEGHALAATLITQYISRMKYE